MKWKMGLVVVLAFCIMLALPLMAGAESSNGTWGNLTWTLDDQGILTINGTGSMNALYYETDAWHMYGDSVRSVSIQMGITNIGDFAFTGCSNLLSITLPDSITSIGQNAFYGCSSLENISIPDSITNIGKYAFYNCGSLTRITIPSGINRISDYAFSGCSNLTVINIPVSVTNIGEGVFVDCTSLTNITVPNGVTTIGNTAFAGCSNLVSIILPESITSIGNSAFTGCTNVNEIHISSVASWLLINYGDSYSHPNCMATSWHLYLGNNEVKSITIPEGITSIDENTFYNCASLMSVTIPNGVTSIGAFAFCACNNLTSITIPGSVTSIGNYAVNNNQSLTSVILQDGVANIGFGAFSSNSKLTSITIPNSVNRIGDSAFQGCTSLSKVYYNGTEADWNAITVGKNNSPLTNAQIYFIGGVSWILDEDGLLTVSRTAVMANYSQSNKAPWYNSRDLILSVYIVDGATGIGNYAFFGCSNLTSVTIPNSVTSIGESAFQACISLTNITIPNNVTSIGMGAFIGCKMTSVTIPNGVARIDVATFRWCESLTNIIIPSSVTSIDSDAFGGCTNLSKVFYTGTEIAWNNISIGNLNLYLTNAEIIFNYHIPVLIAHCGNPATCINPGIEDYWRCEVCGKLYADDKATAEIEAPVAIPALGHTAVIDNVAVAPTCINTGLTEGKHCERCGDVLLAQEEIAALGHIEVVDAACGDVLLAQEEIAALGHIEVVDAAVAPTCINTGLTEGKHCERCSEVLLAQEEIAALGHIEVIDTAVDPTCINTGLTEGKHCERCGDVLLAQEVVPASGHDWQDATYTWSANYSHVIAQRVCRNDGHHTETEEKLVIVKTTSPSMTESGEAVYTSEAFENEAFEIQTKVITIPALQTLSVLRLPVNIQVIEEEAFEHGAFEAVIISEGCTVIGSRAFANCTNLVYVRIPASVTSIADDAFAGCIQVVIDRIGK